MKIVKLTVGEFFGNKVQQPIRNKRDIILLLLETLKLFDNMGDVVKEKGNIMIYIDKMSRIFYEVENKIFSFIFPFSIEEQEGCYRIYDSQTEFELNNQMISLLISIFKQDGILEQSLEKAMDFIIESAEEYGYENIDDLWRMIIKLWYMEDGYVRYDYDPQHQNANIHPLHHLDINYSSGTTYKLGLKNSVKLEEFKNLLDAQTDCAFLVV